MSSPELYELPQGWEWTTLGEICDRPQYGWTTSAESDGSGTRLLRTTDISSGHIDWKRVPFCSKQPDYSGKYELTRGDILVSRAGSVGVSIEVEDCPRAVFASYLIRFRPLRPIPSRLVALFLKSPVYWTQISRSTAGISIPNINATKLQKVGIPLPPLAEQKRIITKIEQLFQELETARQALQKVAPLVNQSRQSLLAAAFHGRLTEQNPNDESAEKLLERIRQERRKKWEEKINTQGKVPQKCKYEELGPIGTEPPFELPDRWVWASVGELETFIGSGITPRGGQEVYPPQGIIFIRSQNVHPDGLHLEDVAYLSSEMHEKMKRTKVQANDVLLNITGASIGRSTFVPLEFGPANVNQHVCIIRTGWWIIPQYLSLFLNSGPAQEQILSSQWGVTREGLNYSQIRKLLIPLAPLLEQKQIVAKVTELFAYATQAEKGVRDAETQVSTLEHSILAKAFRGELVRQDPKDEPASVLLERIKAQRSTGKSEIFSRNAVGNLAER